jgi:hypothetical protein
MTVRRADANLFSNANGSGVRVFFSRARSHQELIGPAALFIHIDRPAIHVMRAPNYFHLTCEGRSPNY